MVTFVNENGKKFVFQSIILKLMLFNTEIDINII